MRVIIGVIILVLLATMVVGQPIGFNDYNAGYIAPNNYGGYELIDLAFYGVLALFLFAVCLYALGVSMKGMKKRQRVVISFCFAWLAVFGIMRMTREFKISTTNMGGDFAVLIIFACGVIAALIIFNNLE